MTKPFRIDLEILEGEYWWGGAVPAADRMPFTRGDSFTLDLRGSDFDAVPSPDQFAPLFLSSKGRSIRSQGAFTIELRDDTIRYSSEEEIIVTEGQGDLKGAYLHAVQHYLPFTGQLPHKDFFTKPQYNTWIELGVQQTTDGILRYAREILEHGLPPGILMIDEGWQEAYGIFRFNKNRIPDPAYLIGELHDMGFTVMLWVTPLVQAAGPETMPLYAERYLLREASGKPALRRWWNGYSAVLDLSHPEAMEWFKAQLDRLMRVYGVDGFKLDAGDRYFYRDDDLSYGGVSSTRQMSLFNSIGEDYGFNEYRAAWDFGGRGIVSRLHDKNHIWGVGGLQSIIPHTLMQGLLGYAYCCPDMLGGGQIQDSTKGTPKDQELFVRWAQCNALMGMMQISLSPWSVLDAVNLQRVLRAVRLHIDFGETIYALAEAAARTGEPITRPLCYVFPDEGFEPVIDQFMLGEDILVAPILRPQATEREVQLPHGCWVDPEGKRFEGGRRHVFEADEDTLLYFRRG